jgi:hypothetical protein
MATRSTIWIKNDDNETYDGIYCHWDGYLENNGVLLVENYQDKDKVRKLIELGSISSLDAEVDCPDGHSFDHPVAGCVVAYHRDRDEDLCVYRNIPFEQLNRYFEEYNYFFIGNRWKYTKNNKNKLLLVPKSKKTS